MIASKNYFEIFDLRCLLQIKDLNIMSLLKYHETFKNCVKINLMDNEFYTKIGSLKQKRLVV